MTKIGKGLSLQGEIEEELAKCKDTSLRESAICPSINVSNQGHTVKRLLSSEFLSQ